MAAILLAVTGAAIAGCRSPDTGPDTAQGAGSAASTPSTGAVDRTVQLLTAGCGRADDATGVGVLVDRDHVLTAGHVVAGSSTVAVIDGRGRHQAMVVRFDPRADLALVRLADTGGTVASGDTGGTVAPDDDGRTVASGHDGPGSPAPLELVALTTDDDGVLVVIDPDSPRQGPVATTTVAFSVLEVTTIETDTVRAPTRSRRHGLAVAAAARPGDSGAGLFDADGALGGILFAVSQDQADRSWAVSDREIAAFLDDGVDRAYACDPERSAITERP